MYFLCILQAFYQLQQLRKLTLSDNQISRLSPDVGNFAELQEFDISHNGRPLCMCIDTVTRQPLFQGLCVYNPKV